MPSVESQGIRIFFEDFGSGLPIVLGHSFLCSGEMWAPQVNPLAQHCRVVNIDCRGHGRSGHADGPFTLYDLVADVVAVLDHLHIERAVWAGFDQWHGGSSRGARRPRSCVCPDPRRYSRGCEASTSSSTERWPWGEGSWHWPLPAGDLAPHVRSHDPPISPRWSTSWKARFASVHAPSMLHAMGALMRRDSSGSLRSTRRP